MKLHHNFSAKKLSDQFLPAIPKKSSSRPFSGWIYSRILAKTQDTHPSFCKKAALSAHIIWLVLFVPLDMAWNMVLIPLTFVALPIKYTFGMIPSKRSHICHGLPGVKNWLEEIKLVFVCAIEVGLLPVGWLSPRRFALTHHKLVGYETYTLKTCHKSQLNKNSKGSIQISPPPSPVTPLRSSTSSLSSLDISPRGIEFIIDGDTDKTVSSSPSPVSPLESSTSSLSSPDISPRETELVIDTDKTVSPPPSPITPLKPLTSPLSSPKTFSRKNEAKCFPLTSQSDDAFSDNELSYSSYLQVSQLGNNLISNDALSDQFPDRSLSSIATSPSGSVLPLNEANWISQNNGTGSTLIGQALSLGTTATNLLWGTITNRLNPPSSAFEATLNNPGTQLDGYILQCYLKGLNEQNHNKAYVIHDFYISDSFGIASHTLESLKKQLNFHKQMLNFEQTIVIPLVIPGTSLVERNHIVAVLIEDGQLEYYDSKGVFSQNINLSNGLTLFQMLTVMQHVFCESANQSLKIRENGKTHQFDVNNCGAFVAKFIHDRIALKHSFQQICNGEVTDIITFRKGMLSLAQRGSLIY